MIRSNALRLEHRVKRASVNRKRFELESGKAYFKMRNEEILNQVKDELQIIAENFKLLSDSFGNIASAVERLAPANVAAVKKIKRAPVRKKVLIENGVVEKIKRIPATKIVYDIIQKSGNGIDTASLMKTTGFNQRKIHNITFMLKKKGRIKSEERGVYKKI